MFFQSSRCSGDAESFENAAGMGNHRLDKMRRRCNFVNNVTSREVGSKMISLDKFPCLPPLGHLTVCEVEGKVHSAPAECASPEAFTSAVASHPKISLAKESIHHVSSSGDESVRIFVPASDSFLKETVSTWYECGFAEAVRAAANLRPGEGPSYIIYIAKYLVGLSKLLSKLKKPFHPHLEESGERLVSAFSQTRERGLSPVRCLEWHPHFTKLGVAVKDDSVRIYSSESRLVPILKCKNQTCISSLAWRPFSASELAVGCNSGVFLWTVDPNSVVTRPSMSCGRVLKRAGHGPVTSVAWSPRGDVLLTASAADVTMHLWDVASEKTIPLKRVGGGGVCLVSWSPDSGKLFAATTGIVFRVWKTDKWIPERWTTTSGRVQTACWSPCGSVLLFATTDEPLIYALPFDAAGSVFQSEDLSNAEPVVDLAPVETENCPEERVGGPVSCMVWDARGRHLAVVFKESSVVAVFRTEIKTVFKIMPCCFINGLPGETPSTVNFQKNFQDGALLTIAWSTGRIQHFPFVYTELEAEESSVGLRCLSPPVNSPRRATSSFR